jgi:hypothetical protein
MTMVQIMDNVLNSIMSNQLAPLAIVQPQGSVSITSNNAIIQHLYYSQPETFSTPSASPAPQGVLVYDGGKDALTGAREIVMAREEGKAEFYKKV